MMASFGADETRVTQLDADLGEVRLGDAGRLRDFCELAGLTGSMVKVAKRVHRTGAGL